MHHNPLALGQIKSDALGLVQRNEFKKILLQFQNSIQHIFLAINILLVLANILILLSLHLEALGNL